MTDDLQALFASSEEAPLDIDLDALKARADGFTAQVGTRNRVEIAAGLLVCGFFAVLVPFVATVLQQASLLLLIAGTAMVVFKVVQRGESPVVNPAATTHSFVQAHVAALRYQAALLRDVPRWYVGPLVPGMVLFPAAVGLALGQLLNPVVLATYALCAGVTVAVVVVNLRGARRLEAEADAVEAAVE